MSEIEVPKGWLMEPLKNMCDFFVPMRDKPTEFDGKVPWLRIDEISQKFTDGSNAKHRVSEKTIQDMKLRVYPIGTVLYSCSATLGVCTITKAKLTTNQTFIGIFPKTTIFNEYLYYYLKAKITDLTKLGKGTTISYISRQKFENFHIVYPANIEDQKKIVQKLDYILGQLEEKKKQIIQRMNKFDSEKIHRIYQNHLLNLAFIGALNGNRSEDIEENQNSIPTGWELSTVGKIAQIKGTTGSIPENKSSGKLVHFIKVSDMNNPENSIYIKKVNISFRTSDDELLTKLIPPNSIIFPKRGGAIFTNKKRITTEYSSLDPNVMAIIPKPIVEPLFLYYYFLKIDLGKFVGQETIPQLNKYDIEPLEISYPKSKETQKNIIDILDRKILEWEKYRPKIENIEKQHQQMTKEIDSITNSILKNAFSGKLVN